MKMKKKGKKEKKKKKCYCSLDVRRGAMVFSHQLVLTR